MNRKHLIGSTMLLAAAVVWGFAFVVQREAMDYIGPFAFGALRYAIGSAALVPVIFLMRHLQKQKPAEPAPHRSRDLWVGGVVCGGFLFAASAMQQVGLIYTTAGKSGFITALYVVLVPLAGFLLFHRRVSPLVLAGILMAVVGLYLLCGENGLSLNPGDMYTMVAALLFTGHILAVDHFAPKVDGVQLSSVQFLVSAVLNGVVSLVLEPMVTWAQIATLWLPLLYMGLMSSGVGYTFQILGQERTPPVIASLLMSMESVFAVLFGVLVLKETMRTSEIVGCVLMFAAVIAAQIPWKPKKRNIPN